MNLLFNWISEKKDDSKINSSSRAMCLVVNYWINPFSTNVSILSSHRRCSVKKLFLKISQCSQENTFVGVSVFSCESCEIFKNTYFEEHLRTTAFGSSYRNKSPDSIVKVESCKFKPLHMLMNLHLWGTVVIHYLTLWSNVVIMNWNVCGNLNTNGKYLF